ncbi:MAG: S8 family peptidase [Bacillota bacterium]|nr:S8 family peptidase [Bacillota bacterium]
MGGVVLQRISLINAVVAEFAEEGALAALDRHGDVVRVDEDLPLRLVGEAGQEEDEGPGSSDQEAGWPPGARGWRRARRWLRSTCERLHRLRPGRPAAPGPSRERRPSRPVVPPGRPLPPPGDAAVPWGVRRIQAPEAWEWSQGEEVHVAVLDTGVDLDHPALADRIGAGINLLRPGAPPEDDNGHGTHVAGVIAAHGSILGVAPRVWLHPVKALDQEGGGRLSHLVLGLEWCLQHRIQVVNLSLGSLTGNRTMREAVRAASRSMVLVCAAGNAGPSNGTVLFPARYPEVLAVGAIDRQNRVARFSSRGPELDLVAPGVDILSLWPSGGLRRLSGTSMAAPHVSGSAALALARGIAPREVPARLRASAEPVGSRDPQLEGAGCVDALAVVQASPAGRRGARATEAI